MHQSLILLSLLPILLLSIPAPTNYKTPITQIPAPKVPTNQIPTTKVPTNTTIIHPDASDVTSHPQRYTFLDLCKKSCPKGSRLQFCNCVPDPCNLDDCAPLDTRNYKYCFCIPSWLDLKKCLKKCHKREKFNIRHCICVFDDTYICKELKCPKHLKPDYSICECISKLAQKRGCKYCRDGYTRDKYCNCIPIQNNTRPT